MARPSHIELLAVTPRGSASAGIAIGAARAGATGVVDLCESAEPAAAAAVAQLLRLGGGGRRGARHESAEALAALPAEVTEVVIPAAHVALATAEELAVAVERLHSQGRRVLVEVLTAAQGGAAVNAGADVLIAKGNESGGNVGETTTFVLVQALARHGVPVLAQGGVGLHTAAACLLAGASGLVLDGQLLTTAESPLPPSLRRLVGRLDGSETVCVGERDGETWRLFERPGERLPRKLSAELATLAPEEGAVRRDTWRALVRRRLGWREDRDCLVPIGQNAALALPLSRRFATVGGIVAAFRSAAREHLESAARSRPLAPGAPLARAHGTRLSVAQGPMTRVSDQPAFAAAVAGEGALPFLALALKSEEEVARLLNETRAQLGARPFAVGILGFVPHELRRQQWDAIRRSPPSLALIAGGRPDQALAFEREGIPTYLHVPSPTLLEMFVEAGARRFVFEGRECGGHVGPRASLLLWDQMVTALLGSAAREELDTLHVLLAGGIHDAASAAAAVSCAAPLSAAGAKVGILMGTAYLFTREAVLSGAIVREFQAQALRCTDTALLETAPGHATRCAATGFADHFRERKARLEADGVPPELLRDELERLNLGRLRLAARGTEHVPAGGAAGAELAPETQRAEGLYMVGQAATLRHATTDVASLHAEVSLGATERILRAANVVEEASAERPSPCDVAIVGMSCLLPRAPSVGAYWSNIVAGVDAITTVPADRWPVERYFDADPQARDRVYSRWGGFLDEVPFDPVAWGMPPASMRSIEPLQLLSLEAARAALADAGLEGDRLPRERTSVVIGAGGGVADLGHRYALRAGLPLVLDEVPQAALARLPEWTEDSFAGILLNVAAGRIANRLDLGGTNYTVDAACASSLAAVHLACRELVNRSSDIVIAGGVDTVQNPFGYLCFAKTHALSPTGRCRTFAADADGIAISEGVVMVVLKRLADAERDGDRIYAVIKAVEGSSDGAARGLTAPHPAGQARALRRAYATAGISPATIGLVEAHGTGTVVGDQAEVETLREVYHAAGAAPGGCAIGSVKSMIGHTKCASGLAGVVKAALALHQQVLPATLHVDTPNPRVEFARSPFYVNTRTRPWVQGADRPRRAAVSAFGFGGTNFHAVLEEYDGAHRSADRPDLAPWPAELVVVASATRAGLCTELDRLGASLEGNGELDLGGLARSAWERFGTVAGARLALVARDRGELRRQLRAASAALGDGDVRLPGVFFSDDPLAAEGSLAFLYPGQGSQHCEMVLDLALRFSEVRDAFARADAVLEGAFAHPLSRYAFPPPRFSAQDARADEEALRDTRVAQPALGAAEVGVSALLDALGLRPAAAAGHSYGEYAALWRAAALSETDLFSVSAARGRAIAGAAADGDAGGMAAVLAEVGRVRSVLNGHRVSLANLNGPRQTVIAGATEPLSAAIADLEAHGLTARRLPVSCAFHSELIRPAAEQLARELGGIALAAPQIPVYANATAAPHPRDPEACRELLMTQLVSPVRFIETVEAMWRDGVRLFVEAGPRSVLTGLVGEILGGRPHLAVAPAGAHDQPLAPLLRALGALFVNGAELDLGRLYSGRPLTEVSLDRPLRPPVELSPTTWMVGGGSVRPADGSTPGPAAPPARATTTPPKDPVPSAAPLSPAAPAPPVRAEAEVGSGASVLADLSNSDPFDGAAALDGLSGPDRVMVAYHRVVARLAEAQEAVMKTYFAGAGTGEAPPPAPTVSSQRAGTADATATPTAGPPTRGQPAPAHEQAAERPALEGRAASPEAPTEPTAAQTPAPPEDDPLATLTRLVAERTGYPPELLDADAALEADLGIDSIKKVEVIGALRATWGPALVASAEASEAFEGLLACTTLRAMADHVRGLARGDTSPSRAAQAPAPAGATPREDSPLAAIAAPPTPLPRFLSAFVDAPEPEPAIARVSGAVVLVTDDGDGTGEAVARAIRDAGGTPVLLAHGATRSRTDGEVSDLTDERAVAALLTRVRDAHGPVGGIVHTLPLRGLPGPSPARLDAIPVRLERDLRSLFLLAREASEDLRASAGASGFLLVATASDVDPGRPDASAPVAHGALTGLCRALAREWTELRIAAVATDATATPAQQARQILGELGGNTVDVAYLDGRRRVLTTAADEEFAARVAVPPPAAPVILITGGCGALGTAIACELGHRYGAHLVLVGRSPASAVGEPLDTVRAAAASVTYVQADVRDAAAFGVAIESVLAEHGRIDVAIHAAGVLADGPFETRTLEQLEAVLATKVDGAITLARRLRPDTTHTLVLFSSVAGRFGNAGQSVYAAANATLAALATDLDRRWRGRVMSIDWGPWLGGGMVSVAVEARFRALGIEPIDPVAGAAALVRELELGRKGESEVIVGHGPWERTARATPSSALREGPERAAPGALLRTAARRIGTATAFTRVLDPAEDPFLDDHRLDDHAVLPAAFALEMMAEAFLRTGGSPVPAFTVEDFRVLRGVVVAAPPLEVVVTVEDTPRGTATISLAEAGATRPSYRATFRPSAPDPEALPRAATPLRGGKTVDVAEAYEEWLFHGPTLQGIARIATAAPDGVDAVLALPDASPLKGSARAPGFLIDPVLVDSAFQLSIVWARTQMEMTTLPAGFRRLRQFGPRPDRPLSCTLRTRPGGDSADVEVTLVLRSESDAPWLYIEGAQFTATRALNRLAARAGRGSRG